jgi:DNA invertase Pin-like site-specific DNA recombinase
VISGKTFDRPGLTALLDHLRPGDTLAVVRLDRLGRSLRELLDVVETLHQREVALRSLEEQLDTASAAGELVLPVFGALAQFERSNCLGCQGGLVYFFSSAPPEVAKVSDASAWR